MGKTSKILVTVGAVFLFFILFAVVVAGREASGHKTPGILGLILFGALVGALKAIWKKPKDEDNDNNNNTSILQK